MRLPMMSSMSAIAEMSAPRFMLVSTRSPPVSSESMSSKKGSVTAKHMLFMSFSWLNSRSMNVTVLAVKLSRRNIALLYAENR